MASVYTVMNILIPYKRNKELTEEDIVYHEGTYYSRKVQNKNYEKSFGYMAITGSHLETLLYQLGASCYITVTGD